MPSSASRTWEETLGWPPDPVWTESRWGFGIPKMLLFQVCSCCYTVLHKFDPGIVIDKAIGSRCHTVELFSLAHCLLRGNQRDCGTHRRSLASEVVG